MELVVAEKPSVARDIARVLGVRPTGQDAFEGRDYVITWCIGHLVELEEPAAYDDAWKSWRLDALPMIPHPFQLRASKQTAGHLRAVRSLLRDRRFDAAIDACDAGREGELIFRYVYQYAGAKLPVRRLWISSMTDEAIRRGFANLRPGSAMDPLADAARSRSEADWLVGMNATRAVTVRNREGGHTSLYSIGRVQTPTLAMLVERERVIREFVPRDYWEVRGQFAVGDVKFVAQWRTDAGVRLGTVALANTLVARDTDVGAGVVESVRARTVREAPPLLFDLTSLQRTANRRFGFTATRTLELAQALYERHKLLTYPRTDSRHLSQDIAGTLPELFGSLAVVPEYAPFAQPLVDNPPRPSRRVFDDAKVHDHHAIIPTGAAVRLDALDHDERRLYDLVVRRFLGAFHPEAEFAVTEAWIRVDAVANEASRDLSAASGTSSTDSSRSSSTDSGANASANPGGTSPGREPAPPHSQRKPAPHDGPPILDVLPQPPDRYLARGRVRTVAGWQAVAGIDERTAAANLRDAASSANPRGTNGASAAAGRPSDGANRSGDPDRDSDDDRDATGLLPPLVEGQRLPGRFASQQKQTKPPPRYTEATLLGAMESAGRQIDDEALRAAMRDSGLGTPATRAAIIETLLRREFIYRERQHLVPTSTGTALMEALPVPSLASPELTGTWEARLARIARGEESRAAFMADIERYVTDLVGTVRHSTPTPPPPDQPPSAFGNGGRKFGRGRGARGGRGRGGAGGGTRQYNGSRSPDTASRETHGSHADDRGSAFSPAAAPKARSRKPRASSAKSRSGNGLNSRPRRSEPRTSHRDSDLPAELQSNYVAPPTPRTYDRETETRSRIDLAHDASLVAALRSSAPRGNPAPSNVGEIESSVHARAGTSNRANPAQPGSSNRANPSLPGSSNRANPSLPGSSNRANPAPSNVGEIESSVHARAGTSNRANPAQPGSSNRANPSLPGSSNRANPAPSNVGEIESSVHARAGTSNPANPTQPGSSNRPNPSLPGSSNRANPAPSNVGEIESSARARASTSNRATPTQPGSSHRATPAPSNAPGSITSNAVAKPAAPTATDSLTCPRCRLGTLLTGSRGWGCSRWREDCKFVIWFELDGKKITAAQLHDLVLRGKTRASKGERLVLDVNGAQTVRREATS
ncbi:MAG: DNA topoisomerase [Kofleriaceae bacterium]